VVLGTAFQPMDRFSCVFFLHACASYFPTAAHKSTLRKSAIEATVLAACQHITGPGLCCCCDYEARTSAGPAGAPAQSIFHKALPRAKRKVFTRGSAAIALMEGWEDICYCWYLLVDGILVHLIYSACTQIKTECLPAHLGDPSADNITLGRESSVKY
jgi:hypothetical protein